MYHRLTSESYLLFEQNFQEVLQEKTYTKKEFYFVSLSTLRYDGYSILLEQFQNTT